ncbi:hypothetical protein Catovirus_1_179 [Catovirus CTV1]|uniref:Uncharacterized protein n=1 Tax=Catovirus CTV1 TaxID=1977631 RepID=A0A1V0S8U7_9VIRU|nr:hypothetical protein Catovirus_1_179 [Catovirus CTV1]
MSNLLANFSTFIETISNGKFAMVEKLSTKYDSADLPKIGIFSDVNSVANQIYNTIKKLDPIGDIYQINIYPYGNNKNLFIRLGDCPEYDGGITTVHLFGLSEDQYKQISQIITNKLIDYEFSYAEDNDFFLFSGNQ